jgi:hypothetical protein
LANNLKMISANGFSAATNNQWIYSYNLAALATQTKLIYVSMPTNIGDKASMKLQMQTGDSTNPVTQFTTDLPISAQ